MYLIKVSGPVWSCNDQNQLLAPSKKITAGGVVFFGSHMGLSGNKITEPKKVWSVAVRVLIYFF